jgi:hypothetical protein
VRLREDIEMYLKEIGCGLNLHGLGLVLWRPLGNVLMNLVVPEVKKIEGFLGKRHRSKIKLSESREKPFRHLNQ